ncbi:hypothetical protein MVEN_01804400 [Mycena venus]|uniref:HD domain-containing protein n=1 Tax=Mycena venus TaxID=2733690 RepID=A0A8H6XKH8_9AGAR|nr:hypothetical protein MVEN_01804400 [Mycena venus]
MFPATSKTFLLWPKSNLTTCRSKISVPSRSIPSTPPPSSTRERSPRTKDSSTPSVATIFALAILHNGFPSGTPGVPQISFEELNRRLYHTCILHDLGWTMTEEGRAHPAHAMTFELHGGIMAYDHLHTAAPSLDAQQVGDIVQSIVLHTLEFPSGKSSATGALMFLSAWFDVCGYHEAGPGSRFVDRETVKEIEKEYPRGAFAVEGKEVLDREFSEKPNTLLLPFPRQR